MSGDGWLRLFGESSDHHVRRPLSPALLQAGYVVLGLRARGEPQVRGATSAANGSGSYCAGLRGAKREQSTTTRPLIAGAHHATDFNIDTKSGLVKQEVSEEEGSTCRAS
jgi:hypothetical protein